MEKQKQLEKPQPKLPQNVGCRLSKTALLPLPGHVVLQKSDLQFFRNKFGLSAYFFFCKNDSSRSTYGRREMQGEIASR
jgi:hypothetical protein